MSHIRAFGLLRPHNGGWTSVEGKMAFETQEDALNGADVGDVIFQFRILESGVLQMDRRWLVIEDKDIKELERNTI